MSEIVLAAAISHSPLLAAPPDVWAERARDDLAATALATSDGRTLSYQRLLDERGPRYSREATLRTWRDTARLCEVALDDVAMSIEAERPDVVVIVGDDQTELFDHGNQPLISAFTGAEVKTSDRLGRPGVPEWLRAVGPAYGMDRVRCYRGSPEFAEALVEGFIDEGVDIGVVADVPDPQRAGVGHAFGFIAERLLGGGNRPIVPVFLNTFYGPNVPTPRRALAMGEALARSVASIKADLRVAVVASGGLSHFVVDEDLDRRVMAAVGAGDLAALAALPREALRSGASEILNWIVVAGASNGLALKTSIYAPVYRTPAGTGCGMGFVCWTRGY